MGIKQTAAAVVNVVLKPIGARGVPDITAAADTNKLFWEKTFLNWIAEAKAKGIDPNDVGDVAWANDPLRDALERFYLPHVKKNSVVLELGPGTGRMTRHLIGRCAKIIAVDYSQVVCNHMRDYLRGKCDFHVLHIKQPTVYSLANESVDACLANGVFEHLDPEETMWFFEDFFRVLRPNGAVVVNFNNLMSEEGMAWLREYRGEPGQRCIFRFYHPEMMAALGVNCGFRLHKLTSDRSRFATIELVKS